MKKLLYILLLFAFKANGQMVVNSANTASPSSQYYITFDGSSTAEWGHTPQTDYDATNTESWTFMAWCDWNDVTAGLFAKRDATGNGFSFWMYSSAYVEAIYDNGSTSYQARAVADYTGRGWMHIACKFDYSTDSLYLLIDGVEVVKTEITTYNGISNSKAFIVGGWGTYEWDGSIDEVVFSKTAVSHNDIRLIKGSSVTSPGDPLTVLGVNCHTYLPMNEGTGTLVADYGTYANDQASAIDPAANNWVSH